MDSFEKNYVIGIDLGTTNCSVSYVDLKKKEKENRIQTFNIPQLTGHGEFTRVNCLPSFLYIPGDYDISKESLKHPWNKDFDRFPGVFARDHGAKIPSRLVSSAKSWLCNSKVDREAKILPWGAEGLEKVSPVNATSEYLKHIKNAWNHYVKDEDLFFENQYLVITVPASFDESARSLTLKAAAQAGLAAVTLLEEPLAAFYSWLIKHEKDWPSFVNPGELVLVCDVGGGTTDFTLITLKESQGSPRFERLAVGDHLMLGGDNIDRSAAELVASRFKAKSSLNKDKWKSLCFKCRQAKEKLFGENKDSVRITLKGEGRSLISGTLAADLTTDDLKDLLSKNFFTGIDKKTGLKDFIVENKEKVVSEFGILSEKEESISKHIIRFLENQRQNIKESLGKDPMPDHILFNGGSLKPGFIQDRIRQTIRGWFDCKDETLPRVLGNEDLDLAVGFGASYYGLVKQGVGVRVGSGSPRSYYIGVADDSAGSTKAVCVVERGLDEGSDIALVDMEFEVLANRPVSFDIFSSSFRSGDCAGDKITIDDTLTKMPPLETIIKFGKGTESRSIPVRLQAAYTEMGSLSMSCDSLASDHKWELQFQLRNSREKAVGINDNEIFTKDVVKKACQMTDEFFNKQSFAKTGNENLVKKIEKHVGQKKAKWPLGFSRAIADRLLKNVEAVEVSPEHEVRWLNLTGFCMRPGFGDAFDSERIKKLWKVYLSGLTYPKQKQNRLEWWVFLRRIAGGFNAGQQRQFFQNITQYVLKEKSARTKISPQEYVELWMAVANLERLLVKDKVVLARTLITELKPGKAPRQLLWALSRIGAREPLYGSVDRVVPPKEISNWIRGILKKNWKNNDPVPEMVIQMVRKTNDRTRDIDSEFLEFLLKWLSEKGVTEDVSAALKTRTDRAMHEQNRVFGESLPAGLVLKNS